LIKVLWWDGDGLCLFAKRLERGRFIWPQATGGVVSLTPAQLSMLLEGIDWRRPITHLCTADGGVSQGFRFWIFLIIDIALS
jgi:transposase